MSKQQHQVQPNLYLLSSGLQKGKSINISTADRNGPIDDNKFYLILNEIIMNVGLTLYIILY